MEQLCGSKRVSTSTRGIVLTEEMEQVRAKSASLPVNRWHLIEKEEKTLYQYDNGILSQEFSLDELPQTTIGWNIQHPDQENVSILETKPEENAALIQALAQMFGIEVPALDKVAVRHLTKWEGGFSQFSNMDLGLPEQCHLILINRSQLPIDYRYFHLAQDWTKQELPWIQLYQFRPDTAFLMNKETFLKTALTPCEELLYRNEVKDIKDGEFPTLKSKVVTHIDLFAIPVHN